MTQNWALQTPRRLYNRLLPAPRNLDCRTCRQNRARSQSANQLMLPVFSPSSGSLRLARAPLSWFWFARKPLQSGRRTMGLARPRPKVLRCTGMQKLNSSVMHHPTALLLALTRRIRRSCCLSCLKTQPTAASARYRGPALGSRVAARHQRKLRRRRWRRHWVVTHRRSCVCWCCHRSAPRAEAQMACRRSARGC